MRKLLQDEKSVKRRKLYAERNSNQIEERKFYLQQLRLKYALKTKVTNGLSTKDRKGSP